MRRVVVALAFVVFAGVVPGRAATASYSDLGTAGWARSAIENTAVQHDWIAVRGTSFGPSGYVTRGMLARAVVLAFPLDTPVPCVDPTPTVDPTPSVDPTATPDPSATPTPDPWWTPGPTPTPCPPPPPAPPPLPVFSDLAPGGSAYRFAAQAVQRGLMAVRSGNRFDASAYVTKAEMDRTLVRALNVGDVITAIDHISSADGYRFRHATQFAYAVIAARLHFHYNYPGFAHDPIPASAITRADFAYALDAAKGSGDWRLWSLQAYKELTLPKMDATRRKVVEFALAYAEHPYVWGGITSRGFDCSGFVWWVLRKGVGPSSRGYAGWALGPRTSFDMARTASPKVLARDLRPLDIMLFDEAGSATTPAWKRAGHAGVYLGNGWYIHSSGGNGGVGIDRLGSWGGGLLWGRHLIPA